MVISLLSLITISSCSSDKSTEGGLLWQITGNGLNEPSYLFGTNHGMTGDFLNNVPRFFEVLDSVKQLAVESDPSRPKRLDSIKPLNKFLPTGTTYQDLLDRKELAVLDSVLAIYTTVNSEKMNLIPGILSLKLSMSMLKRESQKWAKENSFLQIIPPPGNIDFRVLKIARFRSYPIIELDSEEEMDRLGLRDWSILFSSDDLRVQAKELVFSIKQSQKKSVMNIRRSIQQAYFDQNLALLEKWSTHPDLLNGKKTKEILHHSMTTERNIFWMDKIVSAIEQYPTLIMVGALHLPGESGLINLLREKGYTVQTIK